jgi:hypothetical protein
VKNFNEKCIAFDYKVAIFCSMARTIHATLDENVHRVLKKEADRLGISVSKVVQRAIVFAFGIKGVPVFTYDDLRKAANDNALEVNILSDEKEKITMEEIEEELTQEPSCKIYHSPKELITDLRREN